MSAEQKRPTALAELINSTAALLAAARAMDATLQAVYDLNPADHATSSRDYGRGFAEALRVVRSEIDRRMGGFADSTGPQVRP